MYLGEILDAKGECKLTKTHEITNNPKSCELDKGIQIQVKKNIIVQKLREKGYRITKQRLTLIDIILENECSSCKEIFYKAVKIDNKIGAATVYRMINALEDMGVINRKNMYRLMDIDRKTCSDDVFIVYLDDGSRRILSYSEWSVVVKTGLSALGFSGENKVVSVEIRNKKPK